MRLGRVASNDTKEQIEPMNRYEIVRGISAGHRKRNTYAIKSAADSFNSKRFLSDGKKVKPHWDTIDIVGTIVCGRVIQDSSFRDCLYHESGFRELMMILTSGLVRNESPGVDRLTRDLSASGA